MYRKTHVGPQIESCGWKRSLTTPRAQPHPNQVQTCGVVTADVAPRADAAPAAAAAKADDAAEAAGLATCGWGLF